ncbi:mammalian cell entry protein [Mycolicibacterium duvalii]|uniref:Mammalian cell entry protein n=1 Tax=Mycolicibacterium duvalii TaxID=39688 RepID=A0A7I7K2P0_9MYCO|nr:MCE family protein [Mycolicibacterium duvalii]MCV7367414.1 MCE family protein [Mycolicibacterium duvalii]PEG39266.1 mammalian cell entry protein [Mycolicibacterium duvalii]BBX17838.1 mammalian cell entry protein [Mycolicibacterium duvalii]
MTRLCARALQRWLAVGGCVAVTVTGCSFDGLNSLPLPGTVGTGSDAVVYHLRLANVGTLESNSPVMVNDVVVGAVGRMTVTDWHAEVDVSVQPDVVVPANAVATVGQTSLLGSMHVALDPPVGEEPTGRLQPGALVPLQKTSTYPSTEQTLSSLSVVVNGGGLTQIGDIIENFNAALDGRQDQVRSLITRMNDVVGILDRQRENILTTVRALHRLSETFAGQRDTLTAALRRIPEALDVLDRQRPQIVTAMQRLGEFSDTATQLIDETQGDIVTNLRNLEPTVRALADVGPDLATALSFLPTYPYTQEFIDRGIRGDYMNQFIVFDFTISRLKSGIFLGTRWGEPGASLVPAPGDPWYSTYTRDPLMAPVTPVPDQVATMPPLVEAPAEPAPAEGGN